MSWVATGRSRTVTWASQRTGNVYAYTGGQDVDDNAYWTSQITFPFLNRRPDGFSATNPVFSRALFNGVFLVGVSNIDAILSTETYVGSASDFATLVETESKPPFGVGSISRSVDWSVTWTTTAHEYWRLVEDTDTDRTSLIDGRRFPNHGGAAVNDHLPAYIVEWAEIVQAGATVTLSATVTVGSSSGTSVSSAVTLEDMMLPYGVKVETTGFTRMFSQTVSQSVTGSTLTFMGKSVKPPVSWTSGRGLVSFTNSLDHNVGFDSPNFVQGEADVQATAIWEYDLRLRARHPGGTNTTAHTYEWFDRQGSSQIVNVTGGTGLASATQQDWIISFADVDNDSALFVQSQYSPVNGAWRFTGDDDASDWRSPYSCFRFAALGLSRVTDTSVDEGSSLTGWVAGANTTLTVVSGSIRAVVSGGTGSATFTPTSPIASEGFRYLRVRVRSVGSATKPFTVSITDGTNPARTKTWTSTTGASDTFVEVDLDLCRPHNETATTDDQESRYPLSTAAPTGVPSLSGPYWGVSRISELRIEGLEDGATYDFDYVRLQHTADSTATFLPWFGPFKTAWQTGGTTVSQKPFCLLSNLGRTVDLPGQLRTRPPSGAASLQYPTISDLIASINALGGYTATTATYTLPGHDASSPALWVGGGGATYDGLAWADAYDLPVTTASATVFGQSLADTVLGYPECGDVFDGSAPQSGPMVLRANKVTRHRVGGLAFDGNAPLVSNGVSWVRVGPIQIRGTATTSTQGVYLTGTPWGWGGKDHKAILTGFGAPSVLKTGPPNRSQSRACFAVVAATASGSIAYDVSPSGRHVRAYPQTAGLTLGFASNSPEPLIWADRVLTGNAATRVAVAWCRRTRQETLYVAKEQSGSVTVYVTTDEGASLTTVETVPGTSPALVAYPDGIVTLYYRDGGGTVAYRRYSSGTLTGSGFTGVSCADLGLAAYVSGEGRSVSTVLLSVSGTAVQRRASSDGVSFGAAATLASSGSRPFGACSRDGAAWEGWVEGGNARGRAVSRTGDVLVATLTMKAGEAGAVDFSSMGPGDFRGVLLTLASGTAETSISRNLTAWP